MAPSPLSAFSAAARGDAEAVAAWLDAGVCVDARESGLQRTMLMIASGCGHERLVQLLLKCGASVDLLDAAGFNRPGRGLDPQVTLAAI